MFAIDGSHFYDHFPAMTLSEQFLAEVDAFLSRTGMDPTRFGRQALNDPNFVFSVRKGRSPSLRTIDRVRQFMADAAPTDAA